MTRVRSGGLPLRVAPLIVALVLGASALAPMAAATAKPKAKHHTVHKRAKKHKAKHVAKPKTASETCTPTPATPGAIDSATQAFIAHLYAAHLSTSPAAQVQSILSDPNNYVLVHTALVQAMLSSGLSSATSIGSVLQGVTTPLFAHIYSAHLSQSPEQQVQSIVSNPDAYILLHTVWAESMLTPLTDWFEAVLGGAPGDSCPAGGGTGGSTGGGSPPPPPPTAQSVMIMNYSFMPSTLTVSTGTKVTWTNDDTVPHTVTSSGGGPLNSPNISSKGTWSYTFSAPGTYKYYCAVHPNMTATITVK